MKDDPGQILRRGLADLEADRVSDFEPGSEPYCGVYWMLSLVPSVLAIGAAAGAFLWLWIAA